MEAAGVTEYEWTSPSGVRVVSCKPEPVDTWARSTFAYLRGSYTNIAKVTFWQEPRRDLRIWMANRGVSHRVACRVAGHVYGHMTKVCYCGKVKEKAA